MKNKRITANYQGDLVAWIDYVQKREGFDHFTTAINWIIRKAKQADDKEQATLPTSTTTKGRKIK